MTRTALFPLKNLISHALSMCLDGRGSPMAKQERSDHPYIISETL